MRFALVGNDADGVELARALAATGRHEFLYAVDAVLEGVKRVSDLEEVLADPAVEAVVIASRLDRRATHLRRALQSERTVVCLHPADTRPDGAYEAGMMQQDTRQVLLPLLPDAFHPAILRLKELLAPGISSPPAETGITLPAVAEVEKRYTTADGFTRPHAATESNVQVLDHPQPAPRPPLPLPISGTLGELKLLEVERWSLDEVLLATDVAGASPCLPGWDVLRALGGEIAEVSALTWGETLEAGLPVLLAGRFEKAGLLHVNFLPRQPDDRLRLRILGSKGSAELLFPRGSRGPSTLSWQESNGSRHEEGWDAWDPWPVLAEVVEDVIALARTRADGRTDGLALSWQDAVRCLELDDAARRSVAKRRVSQLEYPEASEEVTFKGTMTLIGCGLLWGIILLVILSRWVTWLGWTVGPVLGTFLLLQLLRWIIPSLKPDSHKETKP